MSQTRTNPDTARRSSRPTNIRWSIVIILFVMFLTFGLAFGGYKLKQRMKAKMVLESIRNGEGRTWYGRKLQSPDSSRNGIEMV